MTAALDRRSLLAGIAALAVVPALPAIRRAPLARGGLTIRGPDSGAMISFERGCFYQGQYWVPVGTYTFGEPLEIADAGWRFAGSDKN